MRHRDYLAVGTVDALAVGMSAARFGRDAMRIGSGSRKDANVVDRLLLA